MSEQAGRNERVPDWFTAALDAPERFQDILEVRRKVMAEPYRVQQRIVPEIEAACKHAGRDDAWKTHAVRVLLRAWLECRGERLERVRAASKDQAARAAAVAKAADGLLRALDRAQGGLDLCRVDGVEPVLLDSGLVEIDMLEARPVIEELAAAAHRRATPPQRGDGYASSLASMTTDFDKASEELGFRLSHDATADFFELADLGIRKAFTVEAIKRARARTIRK